MGIRKGYKKFKSNSTYITRFAIYIIGVIAFSWVLIRLVNATEQELIQRFINVNYGVRDENFFFFRLKKYYA